MRSPIVVAAIALVAFTSATSAQGPAPTTLQGGVPLAEQFSGVSGIVELASGSLLVYDLREKRIVRVDPRTNAVSSAASLGRGPLEFQQSGILVRDPRGGAFYVDVLQRRLLRFDGEGKPVGTVSLGTSPLDALSLVGVFGADRDGRLYAKGSAFRVPTRGPAQLDAPRISDSVPILRIAADGATRDTLRWVASDFEGSRTENTPTGMRMVVRLPNGAPSTVVGVLSDGRLVTLEAPEYRLRTRTPDGRTIVGPPVPHTSIPLTVAARTAAVAEAKAGADSVIAEMKRNQSRMRAQIPPGSPAPPMPSIDMVVESPPSWSPTIEPWSVLRVAANDLVLVTVPRELMGSASHTDVLDRDGRLLARIAPPKGEGLSLIASDAIYTTRKDADELVTIVRYPLPASLRR